MIIDVFKEDHTKSVFDQLVKYNEIVREACAQVTFAEEDQSYDLRHNHVSYWYNPDKLSDLAISHHYPHKTHGLTRHPKFNLLIYFPNYISIYLINLLYSDRKTVLIEDMAGGDGRLSLYLSKLGFSRFNITENFTQLSKFLLNQMMKRGQVPYTLNAKDTEPTIINLVGWTELTRPDWPLSCEFACFYNNTRLTKEEDGKCFVLSPSGSYIEMPDFVHLCTDIDQLTNVFCHRSKLEEYTEKIRSRGIIL